MTTRTYPLSAALSVVHSRLVCPFDTYRDFLDYHLGHRVPMWDLSRARARVARSLGKRFPELTRFPPPDKTDSGNANKYVKSVAVQVGYDTVSVSPYRARVKPRTATVAIKELMKR